MKRIALVVVAAATALVFVACPGFLDTPVSGVSLNESTTTIAVGLTEQLTATVTPAGATNTAVTWSTSSTAVATVSAAGLVTAVSAGTATVTVTADGGHTATCAVTVDAASVSVTGVTLDRATTSIGVGSTVQLAATAAPAAATNQDVTWASSDATKATVSATGLVTGVASGSATITVTTVDGAKTATCAVSVVTAIYAAGYSTDSGNIQVAGYWKDGLWVGLAPAVPATDAQVFSLAVSGSDIYAAGFSMDSSGSAKRSALWTNGTWADGGAPGTPAVGTAVVVSGSHLYSAGWATGVSVPGVKSGGYSMDSFVDGLPVIGLAHDSEVVSIFVVGGVVYAGGYCKDTSDLQKAVYWKATPPTPSSGILTELQPPAGATTKNSGVNSVFVSGTDVYAAGFVTTDGNAKVPGYWKIDTAQAVTTWQDLTPLIAPLVATSQSEVASIFVAGTDVYAGGMSTAPDGTVVPGYWKNGTWTALPVQAATPNGGVNSLVVVGSDVYAGGVQLDATWILEVAGYWANGVWVGLSSLDPTRKTEVRSLVVVP